ncbi:phenylacetate--CoA ligase family protein [Skermania piniformis]|uniref:Phenylacetate--CoA ligase family protein n=1 Tax=Skermania pinensis TaxID=39122 RepID=A0ABX8S671_9ACTN|nr:hypothetical protein [Skermania piniformis]QXQ12512.1 phenylacetate--CoA ligase family protein [Skermania piniformis]
MYRIESRPAESPGHTKPGFRNALDTFRSAARRVPAYRDFLRVNGVNPDDIRTPDDFAQVPPVTKANYLTAYPARDLLLDGEITAAGSWSSSSGSSGKPFFWPRAGLSLRQSSILYRRIFAAVGAGEVPTLLVNGYALGNWIGGVYTYQAATRLHAEGFGMSVVAPGARADAIRESIAELGPHYDRVVLTGYPPMVRDVLDGADARVLRQDLRIVMAGEAIGEEWRDLVLDLIGKPGRFEHTNLTYGTADAGIMAHETATSVAVRRIAAHDPGLRNRLFGNDVGLPTFVEYDPELRFVETGADGRLVFTIDNVLPLVRYRIGDVGATHTAGEIRDIVRESGRQVPVETSTPDAGFVVLRRRAEVATTFYAVKLYPDGVQAALTDRAVTGRVSGRFRLRTVPDDRQRPVLTLAVELRDGSCPTAGFADVVAAQVVAGMERASSEYRELRRMYGAGADPVISLLPYGSKEFDGIKVPYGSGR